MRLTAVTALLAATFAGGWGAAGVLAARGRLIASQAPLAGSGQQAQPAHGTGLIVGQVVDGSTGRPVGGALVTLTMSAGRGASQGRGALTMTLNTSGGQNGGLQAIPSMPATGRVLADGEGRFMFHDLPAGTGTLTATAPGYSNGAYGAARPTDSGRPVPLADGERMNAATIRLWKLSTIAGTVTDEAGEPLVNVQVSALRFATSNGTRRTQGGPIATTDDRGAYHFLLQSGDYLLVVPTTSTSLPVSSLDLFQQAVNTPGQVAEMMRGLSESGAPPIGTNGYRIGGMQFSTSGSMGRNSPPVTPNAPLLAYQTTYFPNATSAGQAATVSLGPGEDRLSVDIAMHLATTVRVSGTLVGPEGSGGNMGVRLVAADSADESFNNNYPTANTVSDGTGAFTFLGVPAGQYVLQVTRIARPQMQFLDVSGGAARPAPAPTLGPTLWARMPVTAATEDVSGLVVTLRTGLKIAGRVEFDGASPRPAPDRLTSMSVMVRDVDGNGQAFPARLASDGTFTTQGLVPGRLIAMFQGSPGPKWVLKSIMANGHDIAAGPQAIDGDVTNAVVTFTDHPNELSGTVDVTPSAAASKIAPAAPPLVVLFPANYQAWIAGGTAGGQSRTARVGQSGQFSMVGLPAGDYVIAAISSDLAQSWQDPGTLEAIARGGSRVTMGDDDHRSLDLKPLTIR